MTVEEIQKQRLVGLIDYVEATERDRLKIELDYQQHAGFRATESELAVLPGVKLNPGTEEDPIWLRVDRLAKIGPPAPDDSELDLWLTCKDDPSSLPSLRTEIEATGLIELGLLDESDPRERMKLEGYERRNAVELQFHQWVEGPWADWATQEKPRRETINLYNVLYKLRQELDGLSEAPIELVCGMGFATLRRESFRLRYPLITMALELSLNEATRSIEARPRMEADPGIEIGPLDKMKLHSLDQWRSATEAFLSGQDDESLSPFTVESFEPALRQAAALLDPDAIYIPEANPLAARDIPSVETHLRISIAFAFFQRERRATQLMEDLRRFKDSLIADDQQLNLPDAVTALLSEPSDIVEEPQYPQYRGISTIPGVTSSSGAGQDLFFPKPFNREQVEVVQRLQVRPGVVVQGPPGTGKTHTIANIISHYLALGKRVLVTSQKAPALRVLRDKLPEAVRPLAVSLLDNDREGLKQFQDSVAIISEKLQRLRRSELESEIADLDHQIDNLHRNLAQIDNEVDQIGREAVSPILLNGETLEPIRAARMIVAHPELSEWIPDDIDVLADHTPQFSDSDVIGLRQARKRVGADLIYLDLQIPLLKALPPLDRLVAAHRDLSRAEELRQRIGSGSLPDLQSSDGQAIAQLQHLSDSLNLLDLLEKQVAEAKFFWTVDAFRVVRSGQDVEIRAAIERLKPEIEQLAQERSHFLTRPIQLPEGAIEDIKLHEAISRQAEGKSRIGLVGGIFASKLKAQLSQVALLGEPIRSANGWREVIRYIEALKAARRLKQVWNHLVSNGVGGEVGNEGLAVADSIQGQLAHFEMVRSLSAQQVAVDELARNLVAQWRQSVCAGEGVRHSLRVIIDAHLLKYRLEGAETVRMTLLDTLGPCEGEISDQLRQCAKEMLGNPGVSDGQYRETWLLLNKRLAELAGFADAFETVNRVANLIAESGAGRWAADLRNNPVSGIEDQLLPGDWEQRWRLRRLSSWLSRIDRHLQLRELGRERREKELLLKGAYERSIELRTWLQLSLKATDGVKSALASYADAVRKIGKGTGKGAGRYRREARTASDRAKGALPCWIMPHYRVSESLPADLGLFDLVIVDEASQSTVSALPALLRAKKILIVGDDKQVSPEHVGRDQDRADELADRHLLTQVPDYRGSLREEQSLYDLGKVVFAGGAIMLTEHFRCVAPIIEFSKAQFYGHRLTPLRLPTASERLDPPLIDVMIEGGFRRGDINTAEAEYIVSEIAAIASDNQMQGRTIGVTTLLGQSQAAHLYKEIEQRLGTEVMERHEIRVGDPTTFQGDERDIMFVSLVAQRLDMPLSGLRYEQRFNVALSRARDRTYLVRSVELDQLRHSDSLRRALLEHFRFPFASEGSEVADRRARCESDFEREAFDLLVERGYRVNTQVRVGNFRIDLVIEGDNDRRIAVECDGDRFHGPDKWADDMMRQRILERAGWVVWRCFASVFVRDKVSIVEELARFLAEHGIVPIGPDHEYHSRHSEKRVWKMPREEVLIKDEPGSLFQIVTSNPPAPDSVSAEKHALELSSADQRDDESHLVKFDSDEAQAPGGIEMPASLFQDLYRNADLEISASDCDRICDHDYLARLSVLVDTVIAAEAPIYADLIIDRIARAHGKERSGKIIQDTVMRAIKRYYPRLKEEGRVVIFREGADIQSIVPYRPAKTEVRSHRDVPISELASIAWNVFQKEAEDEGAIEEMARVFGLSRLRAPTRKRFESAIEFAKMAGLPRAE